MVSHFISNRVVRHQELNTSLHHVLRICFTWMHSRSEEKELLILWLLLLFLHLTQISLQFSSLNCSRFIVLFQLVLSILNIFWLANSQVIMGNLRQTFLDIFRIYIARQSWQNNLLFLGFQLKVFILKFTK